MTVRAFVVSDTKFAQELISAAGDADSIVVMLGSPTGSIATHGLELIRQPSMTTLMQIFAAREVREVTFAASLLASPNLWLQAIFRRPAEVFGHIATDWFSATGLVKLLIAELSQSHIEIVGPKDIAAERFYLTQADAQRTGATRATPNGLRTLVAQNAKFRSIATTTEAYIVGRLFNGSLEFLKAESRTTDALIRSVSPRDHERFRSIILVKRIHSDHEVQKLVYPVIGERTIELAHEYGIDEIYVDEFCAIQGKENVIEMCQMWNIKLARL